MAITSCHFDFYCSLRSRGLLPQVGSILEIGQAEWYGDKNPVEFRNLLNEVSNAERRQQMLSTFDSLFDNDGRKITLKNQGSSFALVELFYDWLCAPTHTAAIDLHGTKKAESLNLNYPKRPISWPGYDLVINNGTAEHVFNIAAVFETTHDSCVPTGVMIHDAPCCGWIDHGFYTLQPTLFYDVARENNYEILAVWLCDVPAGRSIEITSREGIHGLAREGLLPKNGMLLVAFRKTTDATFQIPMQGVYAGAVSEQAVQNWKALR